MALPSNLEIGPPSKRIYYPHLDGLRFFAFLLVFIHHHSLFSNFDTNGWIGVDLFFVLSAFLLTKLLLLEYAKNKKISILKFYVRRALRIWPIYFLFITFSAVLFIILYGLPSKGILLRIFGLFAFSDNIFAALKGWNPLPYTAHLWTIAFEEQVYLLIPFLILWMVRAKIREKWLFIISIYLIFSLIRILIILGTNDPHAIIPMLPFTRFESVFMGVILGFGGLDFLARKVNPLLIGLLGTFFSSLLFLDDTMNSPYWIIAVYTFIGLATSMTLLSVLNSYILKLLLSNPVLVFLGKRSYGLYVYHFLSNGIADSILVRVSGQPINSLASFFLSLVITIVISILSYKLIESPFLRLKKKFEIITSRPV